MNIIYEDNHLLIVFKESRMLSQKDKTNDPDILSLAKSYIKDKYAKKGEVYLALINRLDRPVSGLIIMAKTSKAAARLNKAMQDRKIIKKYLAVVSDNGLADSGSFEDHLEKMDNNFSKISKKGKLSTLDYQVLDRKDNFALVEINLKTGRSHQIRLQFASRNHPIYGEQRYAQSAKVNLVLTAYYLAFEHPVTKEELIFTYLDDESSIFKIFDREKLMLQLKL